VHPFWPIIVGLVAMAVFTFVAAKTPSNVVAVTAISAAVFFAGGASGMSWALASVAAPAHCTASGLRAHPLFATRLPEMSR
jgi:hypothetical protein